MELNLTEITSITQQSMDGTSSHSENHSAEIMKSFDELILKMLLGHINQSMEAEGTKIFNAGPWGDFMFNQIIENISKQQGLGFGRLLFESNHLGRGRET